MKSNEGGVLDIPWGDIGDIDDQELLKFLTAVVNAMYLFEEGLLEGVREGFGEAMEEVVAGYVSLLNRILIRNGSNLAIGERRIVQ